MNLTDEAQEKLLTYHWPGNVRELDNVIQRALVICQGSTVTKDDLIFDDLPSQQFERNSEKLDSLSKTAEKKALDEDHNAVEYSSQINTAESTLNLMM